MPSKPRKDLSSQLEEAGDVADRYVEEFENRLLKRINRRQQPRLLELEHDLRRTRQRANVALTIACAAVLAWAIETFVL